jgi:LPXTG-motif cell wall-anchored protein
MWPAWAFVLVVVGAGIVGGLGYAGYRRRRKVERD